MKERRLVIERLTRRAFMRRGAAAAIAAAAPVAALPRHVLAAGPKPARSASLPVVIASANANTYKNGGSETCVEKVFRLVTEGSDVLDAVLAGVNILELDPEESNVGYGGLPNAEGVVQLDASCMHGPKRRAAGVAALEGVRTPSLVAKAVMEQTDHMLLVGRDAQAFARAMGFTIEPDLNTEKSRRLWLEWKRRTDPSHYPDPKDRSDAGYRAAREMVAEGLVDAETLHGTVNCIAVTAGGQIASAVTTSGLAWKIPGRVGDSPIIGAGQYVDNAIGAAGSTGRGEANLYSLASFLIVERMRAGASPRAAATEALRRIAANTVEKRLLNRRGTPNFNVSFYVVNARGDHASVSLYESKYAVCTASGAQTLSSEGLFEGKPAD